ncbi:MAG: ZIP family metal transporter [Candidatus Babeliales bacterium]
MNTLIAALISTFLVSLLSFIGILSLLSKRTYLNIILTYLISFAAGVLLGNAFLHLIPTAAEKISCQIVGTFTLYGMMLFFILEKFLRHQHHINHHLNIKPLGFMNLISDALHNIIDGIAIATSYLISFELGITTTIAVMMHEIPQEFADFGILLHAGFSPLFALLYNFFSGLAALIGVAIVFIFFAQTQLILIYLIPLTAGGFIYIAASNLIPELHEYKSLRQSIIQTLFFIAGIGIMKLL